MTRIYFEWKRRIYVSVCASRDSPSIRDTTPKIGVTLPSRFASFYTCLIWRSWAPGDKAVVLPLYDNSVRSSRSTLEHSLCPSLYLFSFWALDQLTASSSALASDPRLAGLCVLGLDLLCRNQCDPADAINAIDPVLALFSSKMVTRCPVEKYLCLWFCLKSFYPRPW